jgi:hypothetical protein
MPEHCRRFSRSHCSGGLQGDAGEPTREDDRDNGQLAVPAVEGEEHVLATVTQPAHAEPDPRARRRRVLPAPRGPEPWLLCGRKL